MGLEDLLSAGRREIGNIVRDVKYEAGQAIKNNSSGKGKVKRLFNETDKPPLSVFNPDLKREHIPSIDNMTRFKTTGTMPGVAPSPYIREPTLSPHLSNVGDVDYQNMIKMRDAIGTKDHNIKQMWEKNKKIAAGVGVTMWVASNISQGGQQNNTNAKLFGH